MRTDLIRKQKQDFTFNPPGIVLIDEPETHLHLEMQYEIMPLLTNIFPNIQFIIATHSPAVISSIKNALIFDITTKEKQTDEVLGKSFSELMMTHFGLDNEFGPEADELLEGIDKAYTKGDSDKLEQLLIDYHKILTPTLRVQIESRIAMLESKKVIND